jgi:hypothetical protein
MILFSYKQDHIQDYPLFGHPYLYFHLLFEQRRDEFLSQKGHRIQTTVSLQLTVYDTLFMD